jgi:hypothetical protein
LKKRTTACPIDRSIMNVVNKTLRNRFSMRIVILTRPMFSIPEQALTIELHHVDKMEAYLFAPHSALEFKRISTLYECAEYIPLDSQGQRRIRITTVCVPSPEAFSRFNESLKHFQRRCRRYASEKKQLLVQILHGHFNWPKSLLRYSPFL